MNLPKEKGLIHIPVVLVLVVVVALSAAVLVTQNNPNTKGVMIARDDDSGSSGSGSSGSGSSGSSDSDGDKSGSSDGGSSGSGSSGSMETKTTTEGGTKIETKTTSEKQKTEIRFSEEEKIKTEIKEGRTRIDVYSGGVKVRYEIRNGRVIIKAETEGGEGVPEQELFKIIDRVDKSGIKIATAGGELLVARNNVGALSNFPLQIDLNTNQLIASTSAGTRVLTILPDQAVQNMLAANVISRLGPPFIRNAIVSTTSGQLTSVSDVVTLGLQNNVPIYEIQGIKKFNLLGFIPLDRPVTAIVSAETGELVNTEQSLLTRIVDLLSP